MIALALVFAFAGDPCVSGVPIGKRPGPYSFLVATGPERGQPTCFICEQEDKPSAVIFARTLTDDLGQLAAKFDATMAKHQSQGFKAWMTQLTDSADLDVLAKWAVTQGLKTIPVGAFEDADGPPAYKLVTEADVTVLLFVKQKVIANYAFRKGELNAEKIAEIEQAIPKLFEAK